MILHQGPAGLAAQNLLTWIACWQNNTVNTIFLKQQPLRIFIRYLTHPNLISAWTWNKNNHYSKLNAKRLHIFFSGQTLALELKWDLLFSLASITAQTQRQQSHNTHIQNLFCKYNNPSCQSIHFKSPLIKVSYFLVVLNMLSFFFFFN